MRRPHKRDDGCGQLRSYVTPRARRGKARVGGNNLPRMGGGQGRTALGWVVLVPKANRCPGFYYYISRTVRSDSATP